MKQPSIVKEEKTVDLSIDKVWQFIEPAANIAKWFPGAIYSEKISGEGVGRKQLMLTRFGKKEVEMVQEVVEYDFQKRIKWKQLRETIKGKDLPAKEVYFSIDLNAAGEKTRITLQSGEGNRTGWKPAFFKGNEQPKKEKILNMAIDNIETGIRNPQFPQDSLMDALV